MSAPRLVLFGAGAVGRGFVGELFSEAGWTVSFLDVDPILVAALDAAGSYAHHTVGGVTTTKRVGPVVAGSATDPTTVAREVAAASCLATSVGARALPHVVSSLREALLQRFAAGGGPVDVLLCENLHGAAAHVRGLLLAGLDAERAALLEANTGLVETSIGRMIPAAPPGTPATDISVEAYRFLPVDIAAARTPVLRTVPGIVVDESVPFAFYGDRKLHVHNLGHYLCGLLGRLRGHELVADAVLDAGVRYVTRAAMVESATALSVTYGRPLTPILEHVDDLLHRFANRALADPVERVTRDPARKLAPGDRVRGALDAARAAGTPHRHLSLALAAAALEVERVDGLAAHATERVVAEASGGEALALAQLASLRGGFDLTEQLALIGATFEPPSLA